MTLGHALTFIKRGMAEQSLRDRLNTATGISEVQEVLQEEGLTFTPSEFEDAVNSTLVKCTEWEAADQIKEFQMWWEMLQQLVGPEPCSSQKGCSSSSSCSSGGCCG